MLKEQTRMVVMDSINGYLNAMPVARFLNLQLHEPLAFLNQQGVITSGGEVSQTQLRRLATFGPGGNVTPLERPFRSGALSRRV